MGKKSWAQSLVCALCHLFILHYTHLYHLWAEVAENSSRHQCLVFRKHWHEELTTVRQQEGKLHLLTAAAFLLEVSRLIGQWKNHTFEYCVLIAAGKEALQHCNMVVRIPGQKGKMDGKRLLENWERCFLLNTQHITWKIKKEPWPLYPITALGDMFSYLSEAIFFLIAVMSQLLQFCGPWVPWRALGAS